MPEEIFDPEFSSRLVRLLQLKRGHAPGFVEDVIVPVLDLSAALSRAPAELPTQHLDMNTALAVQGLRYNRHVIFQEALGVNDLMVGQIFNPSGSGRLVVVARMFWTQTSFAANIVARHHDSVLTTLVGTGLTNLKRGAGGSVTEIRRQVINLPPNPPIAGMGGILSMNSASQFADAVGGTLNAIPLEPGRGVDFHLVTQSLFLEDPTPLTNNSMSFLAELYEFPQVIS